MADDITVIELSPGSVVQPVYTEPEVVQVVEVSTPIPGGGGGTLSGFTFTQSVPQSVWQVEHDLGRYPSAWSLFDTHGRECSNYVVQHLDIDNLRVAMDVPTAGTFRCI